MFSFEEIDSAIKRINKQGYIEIYLPEHPNSNKYGYILEHRFIVEIKIGRYLTKEEVVHHIDEDKTNNDIDNLMLFKNQKEHSSFHIKLKKYGFNNQIRRQIEERWKEYER